MHIIRDISPQAYILSSSDIALGHPTYLPAARLSKGDSLPRQPIEPMHYRTDGSSKKEQKTERSAKIDERALLGISPLFLSINHTSFPLCRLSFFRVSCTGLIPPNPTPFPRVSLPPLAYQSFFFFFERGVLPRFLFRARALLRLFAFHSRESDCVYSFHQRLLRSEEDFKDLWFAAGVPKTNKASSWWQNENGFKNTQKTKRRRHKPQNKLSGPFQPRTWRAKEREKIKIREPWKNTRKGKRGVIVA